MNSEQSKLSISPGKFKSVIELPFSKSYANRALAIACVTKGLFVIKNIATSSDVEAMIQSLRQIGLIIEKNDNAINIKNSFPECEKISSKIIKIKTGDGGTTNRILLGILSLGKNTYELISSEKFKDRPNQEAFNVLEVLGVDFKKPSETDDFWIQLKGPVTKIKNLDVDCKDTTQFYTGFKCLELVHELKVTPKNLKTSVKYVEITDYLIDLVKDGGTEIQIPIDFSSASYPIVFGSIKNEILIKNCKVIDSLQADSCIIELINSIGGDVSISKDGLVVNASLLRPFVHDCSGCPDLVPSLVFLGLNIDGRSRLKNISILRHKESDRIEEILKIIKRIGGNCLYNEDLDELIVEGKLENNESVDFDLPADHRMIILASMILRAGKSVGTINNSSHVKKSYSEFFTHLLGE
jgi:3-phosphoshikimate 1-carboxyvinyltransferase